MKLDDQKRTFWVDADVCPEDWVEILQKDKFVCLSYYPIQVLHVIQLEGVDLTTVPDPLPRWLMRTQ